VVAGPLREYQRMRFPDYVGGRLGLRAYFDRYVPMAVDQRAGYILESPTWRANPNWAARLGYDRERLAVINRGLQR